MRISKMFYRTMKEVPKEATVVSHQLMFRAGMIQQVSSGIYNYLPLALRSLKKIEKIIREVLSSRECEEVLLPLVQPSELWEESGRWNFYGEELLRMKDRKDNEFCLGPTHEEVITDMVRRNLKSYKQLPWNLFQIQTKFRDEIRPRFGLMRGREFLMKDGYSFDVDEETSKETYKLMYEAYNEIFEKVGVDFKAVEALTGNIGGSLSHEFQVLADSGEDLIISCPNCSYASNIEKAQSAAHMLEVRMPEGEVPEDVLTPNAKTIDEVATFLKREEKDFIKSLVYIGDDEPVLVLIRGDKEINESKLQAYLQTESLFLADDETIERISGAEAGFVGPVKLKKDVRILADNSLKNAVNLVCGANKKDYHTVNVSWGRDYETEEVADFGFASAGEACPLCGESLEEYRGIEVGQVFHLGTKYSKAMNCTYLDKNGKDQPAVMGCYGIGVSRTLAAVIEQNHDDGGIIWPVAIAPYEVIVLPLQMNDDVVVEKAELCYEMLKEQSVEVCIDDRNERAGFKFNDADLVGYPLQICFGKKSLEKGVVEVKIRQSNKKTEIPMDQVLGFVSEFLGRE